MKPSRLTAVFAVAGALALSAPFIADFNSGATAAAPTEVLPSFAPLVKATQPSVVTVRVSGKPGRDVQSQRQIDPQMREFMERFFGRDPFGELPGQRRGEAPSRPMGLGSGFIIDEDGLIVTNNHVIDGGDELTVVLQSGEELSATLVGTDPKTDLAVLRVDAGRDLPTVRWGNSDSVEVGDWAIAIGNPFGLGGTVTAGIVSARGRDIRSGPYDDYLQVDAPINRGNSGGPLFDQLGNVIGVNTAIFSPSGGNVGIGFAIPANQAQKIVADLIDDGIVERGWLGVSIQGVTPAIAESLDLDEAAGAMIAEVTKDSPAEDGGLRRGDIITTFGETDIGSVRDLTRAVADTVPGRETEVTVLRKGETRRLTITTGRFPT
ncbi:MAG: Do family serine endopeptidase [Pseudomonadota bacterium]